MSHHFKFDPRNMVVGIEVQGVYNQYTPLYCLTLVSAENSLYLHVIEECPSRDATPVRTAIDREWMYALY